MIPKPQHIILLGFKHAGKSTVGKALAAKLRWQFFDLDHQIEKNYHQQFSQSLSCREIFHQHGEIFFRDYETRALRQTVNLPAAIIALGGGTPLREENQQLIKPYWLVHITAAPAVVFKRLMTHGKPAFFPAEEDPTEFFQRLWAQRNLVYTQLAHFTVDNSHSVDQTVTRIYKEWEKLNELCDY